MDGKDMQRKRPELHDPHVPRFPVIYKEPTFEQVYENINQADVIQSVAVGLVSFPLGYIVAHQLNQRLARPGMWFTGIIGALGGAMLAYQNSSLRLQGFGRNDKETEKAYQKQQGVFLASKKFAGKKKGPRFYKEVGLGFKTPKSAIEGQYVDKKCPFTGNISIRGRILKGVVLSTKMKRTIIVRRDYLHFVKKYKRFEKRHKNVAAHLSPAFRVKEGDVVTIGQCRPLAKTVRFNVLEVEPASETKPINVRKQFRQF
ncbi:unnamed protein product [Peronospora effusa]|uniref:40S ribosomal protein S11 N-terminal domain-containing protein n=1 Tax=Peronospora effusa TaxID=542832 RepID=A0A425C401_9STRA|nr:hypothetical protein DD237_004275 [Peronospora effusa]CAI5721679.1 unnamed protein product [Peronospora effusa]